MKVLVHLNRNFDKTHLLSFGKTVTPKKVRRLIHRNEPEKAIQKLMAKSTGRLEIIPKEKRKAQFLADFTISEKGYTLERLG